MSDRTPFRGGGPWYSVGLIVILVCQAVSPAFAQQTERRPPLDLRIIPVEGEPQLTVTIEDVSFGPLAGAQVTFRLESSGTFPNGSPSATVTTDAQGQAIVAGFRPPSDRVKIDVRVAFQGQVAMGLIEFGGKAKSQGGSAVKKWWILAGLGGAAAIAGGLAGRGGNSEAPSSPIGPVTVRVGTPTVGGPGS